MNASQKAEFSTKFPTLDKDFSELRKFQSKPLKPRCNTGLKTPNPEGFWTRTSPAGLGAPPGVVYELVESRN